jgi:hypothetical protein
MRWLLVLALSSCTVIGAGTGALIGNFAGNAGKGALIGAVIGLRADIEIGKGLHDLGHKLIFW